MIVREKPGFLALFFVYQGSIAPRVLPQILLIALLSALLVWVHDQYPQLFPELSTSSFAFIGIALSLYLGFRNNACYERWWEGRRLWGQLLIQARSLLRMSLAYRGEESERHKRMARRLVAFAGCLRDQLRDIDPMPGLQEWLSDAECWQLERAVNRPERILQMIGEQVAVEVKTGGFDSVTARNFEQCLNALSEVVAGCERLTNTPLPFAYMLLVHRTSYIYCLLLPFGLVASSGMITPLLTAIVAYAFFGLDELSQQLEQPFGAGDNGLPLDAITLTLERECRQALGEQHLPAAPSARDYRLS
ncbi:membrane protein [Marinobacterium zhoushanense]|uniref:Membrane protein n=1 Tax=Marinobacterium zhoushanense TaxID=1679163 RepID=A0ABQ1JWG1_9GAMM|nr:bestrophin family ion channel [Marinobacterium zhoushanense]GGB79937.1 membrane protein [Marinobacterium zhoushanense]